jgi:hypothetical protein
VKATQEVRPGVGTEADEDHGQAIASSVPAADRLAQYVQGAFVVVVQVGEDRLRRRVFLNLPSAQRAAERARDRGHTAVVALARLDVVGVIENEHLR